MHPAAVMQPHHQDAQQAARSQQIQELGRHMKDEEAAGHLRLFPSLLPAHVKQLNKNHARRSLTQSSTPTPYTTQQQNEARKKTNITHHTCIPPQSCSLTIRMRSK